MNIPPQIQHSLLILAMLIGAWFLRRGCAFLRALRNGTVRFENGTLCVEWRSRHGRLHKIELGRLEPVHDDRRYRVQRRDTTTVALGTGDGTEN